MNESSSESYVHVLCSIARAHSRTTSAVIFLLTTGGVVYLLLRQVHEIIICHTNAGDGFLFCRVGAVTFEIDLR